MILCIFPNDPIKSYYEKGEIKPRYFNPNNIFDEIHVISFTDSEVDESKINTIAGNARLKIYPVGKCNIKNRTKMLQKIIAIVRDIKPDVIRAYNPLVEGWLAIKCAKELRIPVYLSLHIQYDGLRNLYKKNRFKRYLSLKYCEKFIEPFVLRNSDKITIVYKIIEPYVIRNHGKKPELVYNSIDLKRFNTGIPLDSLPRPLIISVGRLTKQKNHECLIHAMKDINANLLIIGDGEIYDQLDELIKRLNMDRKIMMKKSVPNQEIQNYYKSAQLFALAYDPEVEGLPIPVIEAMASGLPVIIPFPKKDLSDGLENIAVFTDRNPKSFAKKINDVLNNNSLREDLSYKSLEKAKEFDNSIIEKREAEIYSELLKGK